MDINKVAVAGTLESNDAMVTIGPDGQNRGVLLNLQSSVAKQFGGQIRKVILETLQSLGVHNAIVSVVDKGALDCTLKARVEAAAYRAAGSEEFQWESRQK